LAVEVRADVCPLERPGNTHFCREGLQQIIDATIAGQDIVAPPIPEVPQVVNLMDALKKSLNAVSAEKKRPAKVATAAKVAPLKRKGA
jgi:non-homologous end joining protein Ku